MFTLTGLTVEWTESDQKKRIINVPNELYEQGCIHDVEAGLKVASTFTFLTLHVELLLAASISKPHVLTDRLQRRWDTR